MKQQTKFKSAEAKRLSEQLAADWANLKKKHETSKPTKKVFKQWSYELTAPPGRSTSHHIPSRGDNSGVGASREVKQYTGSEMVGISIIHKSCLQPIFNQQAAVDVASMRR
jgi:hypothetical protein